MADSTLPGPPPVGLSDWEPLVRDDRVRVSLAAHQWVPFVVFSALAAVIASLSLVPGGAGWLLALPTAALAVALPWYAFSRVGIELVDDRVIVRGVFRNRELCTREIADVFVVADGHVVFELHTGERVVSLAPRRTDNLIDDRAMGDKLALIRLWLVDDGLSALTELGRPRMSDRRDLPPSAAEAPAAPRARDEREPDASVVDAISRFQMATVRLVALFLVAVLVGYLLVGRDVVVLAIAMLVLLRFGRDPGRPLALAAFLLLIIAGVASILQEIPPQLVVNYANRRPTATEAGAIVGVFLLLSTVILAVTERAPQRAPWRPIFRRPDRGALRATVARMSMALRRAWPYAAAGIVAAGIRVVLSPVALPTVYTPLVDNLRLGTGYSMTAPSGAIPFGDTPPLAVGLVAYFPLGAGPALWLVGLASVATAGWYANRRWGRAASIMAVAVAAVLPSLWAQQLAVQLAGLFVLWGVALCDPALGRTSGRAVLSGALLGAAVLARPDAAVALIVVLAWIFVLDREAWRDAARVLVGAVVVMAPWVNFVWTSFGPPWLASTLGTTLNDPASATRLGYLGFAVSAAAVVVVLAALRDTLEDARTWMPFVAIPLVAAALCVTDLGHRDVLGWAGPLAAVLIGQWLASSQRFFATSATKSPTVTRS